MRGHHLIISCAAAWGLLYPVAAEPTAPAACTTQEEKIYTEFLQSVSDLWFLLSGISNKADADAQAPAFNTLVQRICLLDEQLSGASTNSGLPMEIEAEVHEDAETAEKAELLEALQLRILDSFDDVNSEFLGLCRVRCYGSAKLKAAFREAADTGMFSEEALALIQTTPRTLNSHETERELARLNHLAEPDRDVLRVLEQVKDAASAQKAVSALTKLSQRLQTLIPENAEACHADNESATAREREAYEPLNALLWDIRTELVRIAALPGYDGESYDSFSEALNIVFTDLDATHRLYFDDIFDASFRADINDALMENAPSSTLNE